MIIFNEIPYTTYFLNYDNDNTVFAMSRKTGLYMRI